MTDVGNEGLYASNLALSIEDAYLQGVSLEELYEKLPREAPERVAWFYDEIASHCALISQGGGEAQDPKLKLPKNPGRTGLQIGEAAVRLEMAQATLTALLEHHLILELAPYGGRQNRRLLTGEAKKAGFGHNVYPWNRITKIEGVRRSAPFPVLYGQRLDDIMWMLDWNNIHDYVKSISSRKKRLHWLCTNHSYLPVAEIAALAGYSEKTVKRNLRSVSKAA
jgi:hypothetical protein